MGSFLDKITEKMLKPFRGETPPAVSFGAFGKHPGWNDHMEGVGLDSEALNIIRQILYVNGIGGEIDSGAWDNLPEDEVLPEFKHLFFWFCGEDLAAGRMWSSSDGKGRKRYPMVVCAHYTNTGAENVLPGILPELESAERACSSVDTQEAVVSAIDSIRTRIRSNLAPMLSAPPMLRETAGVTASRLGFIPDRDEIYRILYCLNNQMGAFISPNGSSSGTHADMKTLAASKLLPQHMRLPGDSQHVLNTIFFWRDFFHKAGIASAPLLFIQPLQGDWLDLIVGTPTKREFFCMKATPKTLPLVSEVPYTLSDEFKRTARTSEPCKDLFQPA